MGQRHQFWVISKINGRYRVLAAVHHQWAYGSNPIKAYWRLIKMMEDPENKRLARHEITAAAGHGGDWWEMQEKMASKGGDIAENVPFPFLMTCLFMATSFDPRVYPSASYGSRVHTLDVGTSWSQVDNNDGFTILDITVLDKPTYCFTQINTWDEHDEDEGAG